MDDQWVGLDTAERWLSDGIQIAPVAGGIASVDVDVTDMALILRRLRQQGIRTTYNHVVVRAVALTLTRHPDLHVLADGRQRLYPGQVEIGLSVSGASIVAPVMILTDAAAKPLPVLSAEILRRVPEVRAQESVDLARIRRWGRLVPSGVLRRVILRRLVRNIAFRRQMSGTFQVSAIMTDTFQPFLFNTAACLGVAKAREKVVVIAGQPAIRTILTLSCAFDHRVWDGIRLERFLRAVQAILEQNELASEVL